MPESKVKLVESGVTHDKKRARIDAILQGAIDPHVLSGPSIAPRAIDHL